ncbi:MAG: TolB family protein [Gaiellaceae bacterium]
MRRAEERAWQVVRQAFEERTPQPRRTRATNRLVLAAVTLVAVVAAAVASPPGRAVFQKVREVVGVQQAEPALFSLPSKGSNLLVVSADHGGVWLVTANGFKRRLGSYTDAQWSPHGLYVVATTPHQLVALDVEKGVRWTLPRRASWPRWEGTRVDTRIAYMTPAGLRVVAGDGTADRLLDRRAGGVPPAWDPGRLHTLAYFSRGAIVLRNVDTKRIVWRTPIAVTPRDLTWSTDGRYLVVTSTRLVIVLDARGRVHRTVTTLGDGFVEGAFQPRTHLLALSMRTPRGSEIRTVDVDRPGRARLLFAGPGTFGDIAWSPDARWLLLAWPTADQWLFLHGSRVHAVANIREQFPRHDRRGPVLHLDGRWCCAG